MTRAQQIATAYKDYMNDGGVLKSNPWFAFKAGAEWADEHCISVWHDASEEPLHNNKQILSYSEDFDYFFIDFPNYLIIKDGGGQDKTWETVVLRYKMSKWAYIDELLPKGGEKC
jgi:hypothetical protein